MTHDELAAIAWIADPTPYVVFGLGVAVACVGGVVHVVSWIVRRTIENHSTEWGAWRKTMDSHANATRRNFVRVNTRFDPPIEDLEITE